MARQALRVTKEVTPGVYQTSPPGSDVTIWRLDASNLFTSRPTPNIYTVRDAGGSNRMVQTGYGTVAVQGKFSGLFYVSQAKLLLPWACNIISDGSGSFKPAYTVTLDFLAEREDSSGTLYYQRYLGCYNETFGLTANNAGDGVKARLDMAFKYLAPATITSSDFSMPALAAYPSDQPLLFEETAGYFTLGGLRSSYRSLNISVKNILDQIYDESAYPQAIKWCGRDVSGGADFRWKTTTDRDQFNAVSAHSASVGFFDGTTTATFNMENSAYFTAVEDEMPLEKAHYQKVSYASYLDITAGTDLAVTVTP